MDKSSRAVSLAAIGAVALLVLGYVVWDYLLRKPGIRNCADGPHPTIDIREFVTRYSAYSVQLEASVAEKLRFTGKLEPQQLQSLTEAAQQANEFRKFLVAGYNGCAITAAQYAEFGAKFQALDGLARQIEELSTKTGQNATERAELAALVTRYVRATQELGRPGK